MPLAYDSTVLWDDENYTYDGQLSTAPTFVSLGQGVRSTNHVGVDITRTSSEGSEHHHLRYTNSTSPGRVRTELSVNTNPNAPTRSVVPVAARITILQPLTTNRSPFHLTASTDEQGVVLSSADYNVVPVIEGTTLMFYTTGTSFSLWLRYA